MKVILSRTNFAAFEKAAQNFVIGQHKGYTTVHRITSLSANILHLPMFQSFFAYLFFKKGMSAQGVNY